MHTPQTSQDAVHQGGSWRLPLKFGTGPDQQPLAGALPCSEDLPAAQAAGLAITTTGVTVVVCTQQRPKSLLRFLTSLAAQDRHPDQLIIVDASEDSATEDLLAQQPDIAGHCLYFRVSGSLRGITRQRNFALQWVRTDLVAFFDDDVELMPGCLREMERVHRDAGPAVVGVAAYMRNQAWPLSDSWVWRARRRLRLVSNLQPGSYHRSGISIPWNLPSPQGLIGGDWLPGCAMMWKTGIARQVGFYEEFDGYAQGEDLEFSLRARQHGKLLVSGAAHVIHYYESSGRPDPFAKGYMAIHNRYQIHRRGLPDRTWFDILWFGYALVLDTLLLGRYIVAPSEWSAILLQISGRVRAVYDILSACLRPAASRQSPGCPPRSRPARPSGP